jgi:hypothetical protein
MATPAPKFATYADLLMVPDDVRAEVLAGEIVASPARSCSTGSAKYSLPRPPLAIA